MAIPKPEPRDWLRANAQELAVTDREVLAMLRDAYRNVSEQLNELVARDSPLISAGVRRAQLEQTRSRLLANQAQVFERLGDIVAARRARAASRSQRLSAAADAALLSLVGKGPQAQYLYDSALQTSQRAIDAALARMRLSALPLSERIYRTGVWMGGRLGKLINETLASGLNARDFAKRARDWFNPNTPGGVRYAAMRLARTEINNSFHAMSAQKYAETPWIPKVDWNLSGSHPKKDLCNELAEESPYDSEEVPARPHPQCMCNITPKSVDEDEFVENFLKGDYDEYLDKELQSKGWDVKDQPPISGARVEQPTVEAPRFRLTGDEALTSMEKGLPKRGSLTPKQRKALKQYESADFVLINGFLRRQGKVEDSIDSVTSRVIEAIDSAMKKSHLPAPIQAWRGFQRANRVLGDAINSDLTGYEWKELAYSSTSTEEHVPEYFMVSEDQGGQVKMRVFVAAGTEALQISPSSPRGEQAEVMLGRNTKWRVIKDYGVDPKRGWRLLDVEVSQ